ncbi:LptF/LptG family permease [Balneolales bacterium ANBcel1]|nr:LptF/LptG family permease [Balneolales bacterium ANBcel1]
MISDFLKSLVPGSIERDLLKRHAGPFVFCFLTIMFLLLMQFLIQFMDHLVGKGIPLLVIIELILVNLAYMVVLAVPMTILAASLMAYGKFSEQNEYTAVRAAGIAPFRIIRPTLGLAIIITLFLGWFSNEVLPEANYKARALFLDIRMKKPGFDLQENTFYEGIDGYTFLVRNIPSETDSLYDITLFQRPEQGRDRAVIKASKGLLESDERHLSLTLHLYNGTIMRYLSSGRSGTSALFEETSFDNYRITFDLSDLAFSRTNPDDRRRDGRSMRAQAMLAVVDSLRSDKERELRNFRSSLHASGVTLQAAPDTTMQEIESGPESDYLTERHDRYSPPEGPGSRPGTPREPAAVIVPPMQDTGFAALSLVTDAQNQRNTVLRSLSEIRSTQAMSDNLRSNLNWRNERIARFMVEVHKKASIPFACILFALIGAPLGLLVRKGNMGIHAIISTVLFTYYWISIIQGEKLADRLIVSPFVGMWFANMTMAVAAIVLNYLVIKRK